MTNFEGRRCPCCGYWYREDGSCACNKDDAFYEGDVA